MRNDLDGAAPVRLAELIAALSLATDLGMGHPLEHALCSCVLAVRLGDALGLDAPALREVYYQALLRYIGCNAETHTLAAVVGDELAMRRDFAAIDNGNQGAVLSLMLRYIRESNAGAPPLQLAREVVRGLLAGREIQASFAGHCEVAQRLGARLGFEAPIIVALGQLYERWDGRGLPRGLKGEEITPAVLIVALAQDALTVRRLGGVDAAVGMARQRSGGAYDPRMVDCFCGQAPALFAGLDEAPSWETVLGMEPGARSYLAEDQLDTACQAMADFADLKSPYTLGHSSGVAELAAGAAQRYGLPAADVTAIRRAGWLHDLGRVGVSISIWDKPGALTETEWERVRMHPYYTERVLARSPALSSLGRLAAYHHERLDGSGYHRGAPAMILSPAARILAAADAYQAMTEARAHRPARPPDAAAAELRREARAGRLDSEAVAAVLAAAGHHARPTRRDLVAGLSEREVEVLRLVGRGHSMKQIAGQLSIAEKTVDNHIQHIYNKIGVSTRAGAALFAMEQDLLTPAD